MKSGIRRNQIELLAVVAIAFATPLLSAEESGFSEAEKEKAQELVEQLEVGSFAKRASAAVELENLPMAALPWLREMAEATKGENVEVHVRLTAIANTIEKRDKERGLREGTRVKVDLKAAKPGDVLDALEKQLGFSMTAESDHEIWEDQEARDFSFEGSFWDAVDAMLETYPPKEGGRENLGANYNLIRWSEPDFHAAGNSHSSNGVLRVRSGRVALEHSGGKDYLVMTLVPAVEPAFQVEGFSLSLEGLSFGDGKLIEPEKKTCEWKGTYYGERMNPDSDFTFVFPLEKGVKLRGSGSLKGSAKIYLKRLEWSEVDMPAKLNVGVDIGEDGTFTILERREEDGHLKVQLNGQGSRPTWTMEFHSRREAFELLDKDGKKLDFGVRGTSTSGGSPWRASFEGTVKGEPARVRARLPAEAQEIQLEFELSEMVVPGASLFGG